MRAKNLAAIAALLFLFGRTLCAQPQAGTLLWSYSTPAVITTSPSLAADGTIYIGTETRLYAITNAGSNRWTFPVAFCSGGGAIGSPAVGPDGTIYFGGGDATFYALNPDGSQKWKYPLQPEFQYKIIYASSPALDRDNSIYFVAGGRLYAFTSAGSNKWEFAIDDTSNDRIRSPVIGPDGTIYVGSYFTRTLYALTRDGSLKWQFTLDFPASESAAIGGDGKIYVTGASLYTFSPQGSNLWSTAFQDFSGGIPAVGKDGTIYVESSVGSRPGLHAFTPSGELLWRAGPSPDFYGYPSTCPAIDASGMLYFCSSNAVFAITPQGNIQWVFGASVPGTPPPYTLSCPAIGPDGTIYAAFYHTLYAIAGTNGLGNTPWPMYRQNLRHTGEVEKPSLQQPKKRADAGFQLQIMNQLGSTNLIQTSLDLAAWSPLTNVTVTNVPMDFVDWDASNFPARFYRAVQQQ